MALFHNIKIKDQKNTCIQDKTPTLFHKNSVAAWLLLLKRIDWPPLMEEQTLFSLLLLLASTELDENFFVFLLFLWYKCLPVIVWRFSNSFTINIQPSDYELVAIFKLLEKICFFRQQFRFKCICLSFCVGSCQWNSYDNCVRRFLLKTQSSKK